MSFSFRDRTVGRANYTMKDYLIDILREAVEQAEKYSQDNGAFKDTEFFKSSLANAKGTLAGLDHPPYTGVSSLPNYKDIERIVFNVMQSMKSKI